ncbi:GAF domain-containing protein [Bacillus toyonensis]|uniref:histidine kinase n=1 Tax=Bacillus toyonensis TaxID=155322 RepID=A0A2C4QV08_9BACI|nr:GAF domain-containing protein [Bacillus toyonensis]PGA95800.1 hypothetical protein COL93_24455 [Bacillus toyonensis]PHD68228.1 hypothetical protein COF40_18225 [Bacillus toyonensis]
MLSDQARYSRLANITKIINTKLELREVLQRVTMAISEEIVRCNAVGIYLPQEDGTFRGFAGKPETINGVTLDTQVIDPEIDLLAKEVIETKKPIYIPDTSKDHRPDPRPVDAFKIKSLLALPISFGQELFGLVFLFDYGTPMNLTDSEIQSVEAYVNMAAVAIQNANNLTQKENLIAEKQLLLNVTRDLSMCSSIQESFDKCFFYLGQILESKNVAAHLLDPLDKTTKLSKDCDWTEADWMEKSYDAKIQEVIQTKNIDSKGLLMIPLVSMGEVLGVIVVGKEGKAHNYDNSQIQLAKSIVDATAPTFSNLLYMDQLESMVEERTRELAAANEKVTSVIESITDGFFTLNNKWEFTYVNKHQYFPQRKTAKDVLGKNIREVFPSSVDTVMYKEFHRAMSERTTVHFEFLSMGNTKKSDLQMLDLNSIIHDIIPLIKIDTYNQNKYIQVDTNDIPELLLNRNEIRQLLINLYRNGLEAMSTGKVLTISTYKEGQNFVVLAVRDQGKGIRPEVVEKLGTPFYTTKDNGTGLGLGICYAIAARHNAKIEIQTGSEGTTFFVKFNYTNNEQ